MLRRIGELTAGYGLGVANVFHAGDGNLHPLILYDANKPGDLEKAESLGADILRLCVEVGRLPDRRARRGRGEARPDGACSTRPPTWRRSCGSRTCSTRAGC